jgi:formylglycine-generating enzyme required for sulfatase activity
MKRIILKILKYFAIGSAAIILVTIGIDATDNFNNRSGSIIKNLIFGKSKGPCSEDMVLVSSEKGGFCLDKFEDSADTNCPSPNPSNQSETRLNLDKQDCRPVSKSGAQPWTYISQTQAAVACAKAGKRLPTDSEWYYAALGTPDKSSDWTADDCQVAKNWTAQPGLTGSGKNCYSPYGAFDMVGNVWEWVKAEIVDGVYKGLTMPGPGYVKEVNIDGIPIATQEETPDPNHNQDYLWIKNKETRGMARGGYWDNQKEAGQYSVYLVSPPSFVGEGVGFRCAK